MIAPAGSLSELHALHQRAKAIRDRLASGPKTLAARERVLATRRLELEKAQKALKDARAQNKNRDVQLLSIEGKIDDLKTKLNQAKKQHDYDALRNQIAHDQASKSKVEDEILQHLEVVEQQAQEVAKFEAEIKTLEQEVKELAVKLEAQRGPDEALLQEIEEAVAASEVIIPVDQRDQYRRVVKSRTSDAMSAVDDGSCSACFVAVTAQMMNDLINGGHLLFCRTCGRILYLSEKDERKSSRRSDD